MDGGRQAGRQAGFGDTTDYDGGGIILEGTVVDSTLFDNFTVQFPIVLRT